MSKYARALALATKLIKTYGDSGKLTFTQATANSYDPETLSNNITSTTYTVYAIVAEIKEMASSYTKEEIAQMETLSVKKIITIVIGSYTPKVSDTVVHNNITYRVQGVKEYEVGGNVYAYSLAVVV